MSMFDLFDFDKKYPGWNRLIFLPFGHFLYHADVIFDEKVAPLTVMKQNWFDFVLLILGFVGVCFVEKTDYIVNKALCIILFFKSENGKTIILFSLSIIFWIISLSLFIYAVPQGIFLKNFYKFDTIFALIMLMISTIIMFATFLQKNILFKKPR